MVKMNIMIVVVVSLWMKLLKHTLMMFFSEIFSYSLLTSRLKTLVWTQIYVHIYLFILEK